MNTDLFMPPVGELRPIPDNRRDSYYEKYKTLGAFQKHQYDLDICVLYRQVDDLKSRYKKIGDHKFNVFLNNIKENVSYDFKKMKLDCMSSNQSGQMLINS